MVIQATQQGIQSTLPPLFLVQVTNALEPPPSGVGFDLSITPIGIHVGIYAGNNQVIQEDGGLGKVGYLSVAPGTYWVDSITSMKRLF